MAGIGGSCAQNRESCAPLFRLRRRTVRRQRTRRVPAPARPARQRRHGSHPPRRRPRTAAPKKRRAQPMGRHRRGHLTVQRTRLMERHLRGSRLTVQRALTDSVEQRWPTSRSGSAVRQRQCLPAAPEYRRLRAEPGPPVPRRHVSGSAPAPRIRLPAEPARPLPRQHVSCSAPAALMRPRCPRVAAAHYRRRAGRAAPLPRAPGAPPARPTTCAGQGATAAPSAGAAPFRTPGRCSPSTCSGRAPPRAACRAVAPPRERLRPAGRRPGACS